MKCSVVILNWNGEATLRQFLPSVLSHTQLPDVEIVVADNGSTDGSLDYLQTQPVRVIKLDQNYGFAGGYNHAIEQVDAEYTVLLNSDVEVTPHWLDIMLAYMDAHPETLAAQPKVLAWHSKQLFDKGEVKAVRFEHAGAAGGMMDMLGYPYCRGRLMTHVEEDHGQYDDIVPIFWATGACLLVRTKIYKELGGLDANFFAHQEEIDLCWRMSLYERGDVPVGGSGSLSGNGCCAAETRQRRTTPQSDITSPIVTHPREAAQPIVYLPMATVYHVGGATLGYESPRKTFLNFRNNLLMLRKNLPASRLWWVMFIRFFMDYAAALQMLLTHQLPNAKAVFEARLAYHKMKKQYPIARKRAVGSQNDSVCQKSYANDMLAKRSIVWDFYVRKLKQ